MPADAETTSGLSLLLLQPTILQVHVFAAVAALGLGAVMMTSRKGARFHRAAGWTWVALAGTVAVSSLFIVGLNGDHWSWIHILSALTIVSLPLAVLAARRHHVTLHRRQMMGLFYGGFVIAGAFTFLPGRLMWRVFFG
jgi:uncharacterized membrane protein